MSKSISVGMRKLNKQVLTVLCLVLSMANFGPLVAQCPTTLACNDNVQISLDQSCEAAFIPSIILEGNPGSCLYLVRIKDQYDNVLATSTVDGAGVVTHPVIDGTYIGSRWKGEIYFTDANGVEISCWGWFTVEDKLAPEITCIDDITVSCKDNLSDLFTSSSTLQLCSTGADLDAGATYIEYSLSVTGSISPWEIITAVSTASPVTATATTGFFTVNGITVPITAAAGAYDLSGLIGQSAAGLSSITISLPTADFGSQVCMTLETSSFAAQNLADNCSNSDILIVRDELDENECGPAGITAERIIEYIAQDGGGLASSACSFKISYEKVALDDLDFPTNYQGECTNGSTPSLTVTGVPTVGGCDLSLVDNLCKFNITFSDDTTATCGSNFTIQRKWVVLDWCAAESRQSYQTIRVSDNEPPTVTCATDVTVDANNNCGGTYTFKPFDSADFFSSAIVNDCSSLTLLAEYLTADERDVDAVDQPFNSMNNLGNSMFSATLEGGQNWIKYTATDACGNSAECRMEIFVRDNQPPNAICDQYTVVSLADNGWGRLYGPSLDDGSYDQCGGPVTFEVRRLNSPCADDTASDRDDTTFGDYVQFCCIEANETIHVEMKVIDQGGFYSQCTVNVVVQDKYNSFDIGCPSPSTINADCNNSLASIKSLYGSPNPTNTCGPVPTFIMSDNDDGLGDCGAGIISRTWTAVYGQDITSTTCVQRISISKSSTLSLSSFNAPTANPTANCMNFREDTGDGPSLRNDNVCADIGFTFEDNSFFNVEGYCVKVIRTWTAIDFCNYNAATGEGVWQWTQTIKVSDTTGPVIDEDSCPDDILVIASSDNCGAVVTVPTPSAVDACTGDDIPASGFTWNVSGTSHEGRGNTATVDLGVGTYNFVWTATGVCGAGATSTCAASITIEDMTGPSVYCRSLITTVISNTNAAGSPFADIWASDFDLGSSDDCDDNLRVSFSPTDFGDTQRVYECHQLGFHTVEVYFTDSSGNQDFCVASINIQANGEVCDTVGQRPLARIEGNVYTEESVMVENVEIGLEAMATSQMDINNTDSQGHFAFQDIGTYSDYRLIAEGDDDYLNGVSTLDLIMIQRHILGIEYLDSPYKLIAADINGSENINGLDLVELRKLILGIYTELPQNKSWKFVDEGQAFADPSSPWPAQEDIELYQLAQDMMDNDFIAVKVGDVNGTAIVNEAQETVTSSESGLNLQTEVHSLSNLGEYLVPVYLDQADEIFGLQMSLGFDEDVQVLEIESGKIDMENGNSILADGILTISYNEEELFEVQPGEALFYLTVSSPNPLNSSILSKGSSHIGGEVYTAGYKVEKLKLGAYKPTFVTILHQNVPNPFSGETIIEFELPTASSATLKVLDLNGKIVKVIEGSYEKGKNNVVINQNDLDEDGVYYYQLDTENFSATKKMVRVK